MSTPLLGRTNQAFPSVWLKLEVPADLTEIPLMVEAARDSGLPVDISSRPILWGGLMRSHTGVVVARGTTDYERASDHTHATDLVQSHLIETLSCMGRDYLDFYLIPVRRAVEEYQISGALEALEAARQEGHLRYLGLVSEGPALATLGTWQFHDAFEVIALSQADPDAQETLIPTARSRRVGVIQIGNEASEDGSPVLWPVRTAQEILDLAAAQ